MSLEGRQSTNWHHHLTSGCGRPSLAYPHILTHVAEPLPALLPPNPPPRIYQIEAPPGARPLDVDVIDLSVLAVNVPTHRHSVHALNRDMLWDIASIITRSERAAQRTRRLERIVGNVFSFKTSPAHVHCDLL